jgi:ubiquinone/menaquinone biosynthesis C-methylase UbiE
VKPNYDAIAKSYDRRYVDNDYSGVEEALMAFVGQDLTGRALEVGCGTGHWLRLLEENGIRVAGVDASENMLTFARAQAPSAVLVRGRAEDLPWTNESFERLVCINAFHHFEDKVRFLAEARRVLEPGGQMMTVGLDPHAGVDRWYIYEYFEAVLELDKQRYPASSQIREWMQVLQFTNVHTREVQHLPVRLPARTLIDQGRLDKGVTSQLAILTDEEYQRGVDRIVRSIESAEALGEILYLSADLRLYATHGSVPCRGR